MIQENLNLDSLQTELQKMMSEKAETDFDIRRGELNKAKEIRTTEYVLIGTLASFTIAILTGIAVSHLL